MIFPNEFSATFEKGVFRPTDHVDLPEGAKVTLSFVRPDAPTERSRHDAMEMIRRIRRDGLIRLDGGRWTREELYDRR